MKPQGTFYKINDCVNIILTLQFKDKKGKRNFKNRVYLLSHFDMSLFQNEPEQQIGIP